MLACRSRWIDGSATFTTVLSSMIMNSAKHIAASVHHLRLSSVRRKRSGTCRVLPARGADRARATHRRDVLARDDRLEGPGERVPLGSRKRCGELLEAGQPQVDEPGGYREGVLGGLDGLLTAVGGVLHARDETAVHQRVDGAADGRHRVAGLV